MKKKSEITIYYCIKSVFFCLSLIPGFLGKRISDFIGWLWYLLDKRHRNLAFRNLSHAFQGELSEVEIRALVKKNFVNTIQILFEMAKAYRWKPERVSDYFNVKGLNHLNAAHKKGKGILFLTGHVGNWEMSVHLKTLTGINGSGVYRTLDSPALDRFILEKRQMTGCRMYPVKNAVTGIFYELNQGHFTGILCDQNAKRSQGVYVDFFGRKACTNKGLAQFALATGTPVLSYFIVRDNGKFLVEIGPEIPLVETGEKERDLITNTQNYTHAVESIIRRYPDQWLWVHNRWKHQPLSG